MALETEIKELKSSPIFRIRDLREDDAQKVVELFNIIYKGNYPIQEYLDINWIKSQVGNPNRYFKVFEDEQQHFVGCGVIDFDPDRGILYGGRTVIHPEFQGKGVLGGIGMETTKQIMRELNGKVTLFYGTSRMVPGDTGMQRTLEKIGFKPLAFLPDLDTGVGDRESEIFQALIFNQAFKNRRENPTIIPEVEKVVLAAKKQYRQIKNYTIFDMKEIAIPKERHPIAVFEDIQKYYNYLTLSIGPNSIKIEINPKAESAEIQTYCCEDHGDFLSILLELLKAVNERNVKYLEAHVNAYEPIHQRIFYQAGFKVTGYIPTFDTVNGIHEDRVVMVWIPGAMLTKHLEFTPLSWSFVREFYSELGLKGTTTEADRGHIRFEMS